MNYRISNNDELARCFYKKFEVENQIKWQTFPDEEKCGGGYYDYYYAENGLYIIHDRISDSMYFVRARSPKEAFDDFESNFQLAGGAE